MEKAIFYGAGQHVRKNMDDYRVKYDPLCFCDADSENWGKTLFEIPILSPSEAMERFPQADFVITLLDKKPAAINYLINECGLPKERILNYENYYFGKGCPYAQHSLFFQNDKLQNCCENPTTPNAPFSDFYDNPEKTVEMLISMKRKTLERIRDFTTVGNGTEETSSYFVKKDGKWLYSPYDRKEIGNVMCQYCRFVQEGYYTLDYFYIIGVQISSNSDGRCNFRCPYCCEAMPGYVPTHDGRLTKNIAKTLTALDEAGILAKNLHLCIANGEPALHPDLEQLVAILPHAYYQILTNASVYSEAIQRVIGHGEIVMSLDSGTRETFQRIKGVDKFDVVVENLRKYRKYGDIVPKFIVMPGINDNDTDVNGFVDFCKSVDPLRVEVVRDYLVDGFDFDNFTWSDKTMAVVSRLFNELEKEKFPIVATNFPDKYRTVLAQYA